MLASAENYGQLLFAGPHDRKIPEFEEEIPVTTTTEPSPTTTEPPPEQRYDAASTYEAWVGISGVLILILIRKKSLRRNKE